MGEALATRILRSHIQLLIPDGNNQKLNSRLQSSLKRNWDFSAVASLENAIAGKGIEKSLSPKLAKVLGYFILFVNNDRACHVYQTSGFREEGIMRGAVYWDGAYHSHVLMSLLESEYQRVGND